jgi:hypothetical protein
LFIFFHLSGLFPVSAQPDLPPDFEFLFFVVTDPVGDLLPRSPAADAGPIGVITANQFAWAGYCHGLVFSAKQMKPGVVQGVKILKVMSH